MIVAIRADASLRIGSGHVMRCLTLADGLTAAGAARVVFVCRELRGHLIPYIRSRGYAVLALPQEAETPGEAAPAAEDGAELAHAPWLETTWQRDAEQTMRAIGQLPQTPDWLVIDHYALDSRYEERVASCARRLLVIDDLADRPHRCDLLLDQNWDSEEGFRYEGLTTSGTRLLIGPRYALLREPFARLRGRVRRSGAVRRVLVSFGGMDATGEIGKTLDALAGEGLALTVLGGSANPLGEAVAARCASIPAARYIKHAEDVAALMLEADLAIGAGGSSTWERCCLGLPSLLVATARNQEPIAARAAETGAAMYLGRSADVAAPHILEAVRTLRRQPQRLLWMSARAMELTDGLGAARTIREMMER